jgi:bla regulator protein BlaR1
MIAEYKSNKKRYPLIAFALFLLLGLSVLTNSINAYRAPDYGKTAITAAEIGNIDYSFESDPPAIGKWHGIGITEDIPTFDPGKFIKKDDLYLTDLVFLKDGKMLVALESGKLGLAPMIWTKGLVIHPGDETELQYAIKEIEGSTYMFLEWKRSDSTPEQTLSQYLVFEKTDAEDYSNHKISFKTDNTDYAFFHDPEMPGTWECVDYVEAADDFIPGKRYSSNALFIKEMYLSEDGAVNVLTISGEVFENNFTWTKGLILNHAGKLACSCEIKEIEGYTYMFYEFKNGDYVYRGMKPWYYVLRKLE